MFYFIKKLKSKNSKNAYTYLSFPCFIFDGKEKRVKQGLNDFK